MSVIPTKVSGEHRGNPSIRLTHGGVPHSHCIHSTHNQRECSPLLLCATPSSNVAERDVLILEIWGICTSLCFQRNAALVAALVWQQPLPPSSALGCTIHFTFAGLKQDGHRLIFMISGPHGSCRGPCQV